MTISISVAPFSRAFLVSTTLTSVDGCTQGEADHRANFDITNLKQVGAQFDIGRVDANRGKMVFFGFETQLGDLVCGGIWFEQGMVDHTASDLSSGITPIG
jgi:hypothetical protein